MSTEVVLAITNARAEDRTVSQIDAIKRNACSGATDLGLQISNNIQSSDASILLKVSPSAGTEAALSPTRSVLPRSVSGTIISFPQMIDGIYDPPYHYNDFRAYIGKFVCFC